MVLAWLSDPEIWAALLALTVLEIVLGIDNIIFISITASRLPAEQQRRARILGLAAAMVTRILLLLSVFWVMGLVEPLFSVFHRQVSGRDIILLAGGLFLLAKATQEIHAHFEIPGQPAGGHRAAPSLWAAIVQIMLLDVVFSLDSVITAVGMTRHIGVMIVAVVAAVIVMMIFSDAVSAFVDRHPTVRILALSFLILIGVALVAESFHTHIPRGYIYFALAFSLGVEMINLRLRARMGDRGES